MKDDSLVLEKTFLNYMAEFEPFFRKIARIMAENYDEKGDSWKNTSWAELIDGICKQIDDMQNDPDREDYYANIGCYAGMLWLQSLEESAKNEL